MQVPFFFVLKVVLFLVSLDLIPIEEKSYNHNINNRDNL